MGLWGAVKAAQAGLSVVLVDAAKIAGGASGGVMGAMFPWMPDRWDEKKQFQYEALTSLPDELAVLEADTGLCARFRRSGRIIPLPKPHLKVIALRHQADALDNWHQGEHRFFWHVSDAPPVAGYLAPECAAGGYVHDTMAARLEPRALSALLKAWLVMQPNVRVLEQASLVSLDAARGRAAVSSSPEGRMEISFSHALIAAGVESFPILEGLMPPMPRPLGQGVKGQAALLKADLDPSLPVAFLDGLYVVPHEDGHVAVGSTSENSFADPCATDTLLDTVLQRARALVPALRDAPVIERWAGMRPKAIGRDPLVGPVTGHPNVISLTGGFKISFGMAHRLAACAVDYALGREPQGLPENFTLAGQVAREMQA
ncbi:MAG: dependent oxidoreductase [Rhizobium sp.]|nr:dependent oxidoreductase [Rhizobium sp.]